MDPAKPVELPERPKEAQPVAAEPQGEPKQSKAAAKKEAKKAAKKAAQKENSSRPKESKPKPAKAPKEAAEARDPDAMFKVGFLHDVYNERPLSETTPKIRTRFPPEPNGFLHIGHSKAIAINFGFAKYHGGECILRFDDTNPEGEEERYYNAIRDIVNWLGFTPVRETCASDNFDKLYELAEELIKRDGAYMCYCTKAEIKAGRGESESGQRGGERFACAHRDQDPEKSLAEFRAMRDGKYKAGEACLRMKQALLEDPRAQMWDLVAWRITESEEKAQHHRSGGTWKIYPTYDFAHCLCDSIEGITHSLCTTEFELSRVSYDWLNEKLDVYRPMQREYGRLNITGTVLSKRKIIKLVKEGHVRDWDDPRLYTLIALRRRGVPPGAILSFVNELGVTKAVTNVQMHRFDQSVRVFLETTVPRLMVVTQPLKVIIDDLPDDYEELVEVPFGKDASFGTHSVPFTKTVYIERSDFREVDSADYFRLAPGKTVGLLKVPYPITATSFEKDPATGLVTVVHAKYEKPAEGETAPRPKTFIHWVGESAKHNSPIRAEIRAFNSLFNSEDPSAHPDGFLADINPNSEEIFKDAMIETGFNEIRQTAPWPKAAGETDVESNLHTVRFQGMRIAYFAVDRETTADKVILNRIVTLKDTQGKN